jgi:hypothetical protein
MLGQLAPCRAHHRRHPCRLAGSNVRAGLVGWSRLVTGGDHHRGAHDCRRGHHERRRLNAPHVRSRPRVRAGKTSGRSIRRQRRRIIRRKAQHDRAYLFRTPAFEAKRSPTARSDCWPHGGVCALLRLDVVELTRSDLTHGLLLARRGPGWSIPNARRTLQRARPMPWWLSNPVCGTWACGSSPGA